MGSADTTRLNGWGKGGRGNHSSFHRSNKTRFDKSKSACSGSAHTNGFGRTLGLILSGSTEVTPRSCRVCHFTRDAKNLSLMLRSTDKTFIRPARLQGVELFALAQA